MLKENSEDKNNIVSNSLLTDISDNDAEFFNGGNRRDVMAERRRNNPRRSGRSFPGRLIAAGRRIDYLRSLFRGGNTRTRNMRGPHRS